jgi:hypothetical protein
MKRPNRNKGKQSPSLRPPTMMIDLLFGALMLFAFQMGAPTAKTVVPHDVDLPTANNKTKSDPAPLLALKPMKMPDGKWRYSLPDGRTLEPKEIAKGLKESGQIPVLMVPRDARVQDYVDAEQPLRKVGLKAGLAVELDEGEAR